jgi:TonB family protein
LALRPATVLVAVLLAFPATAQSQTIPVSVKNDPGGFSTQYKQIFDYYKKENYFGMTAAFQSFKLPPEWFVETFGPDAGPKLQLHYEYEFSLFVTETEKLYGPLNVALINFVETLRHKFDRTKLVAGKPAPPSLKTIPPIQFFDVDYGSNQKLETSPGGWINGQSWSNKSTGSFVYLDGAFKYFGPSTQPFWETLDARSDENCQDATPDAPIVSMRMFPVLSKEPEKRQVKRTVRVKVRVAPDGRVIEAEPIEGESMLIRQALDAARAWRFFPPLSKCGQPAEAVGEETVAFVLQ